MSKQDFVETDVRGSRIRLTRVAILALVVITVLGGALLLNAGQQVATSQAPTAMATIAPTVPVPTATPFVCPNDPSEWIIQMEPGLTGQLIGKVDPLCVMDLVRTDFEEATRWHYETADRDPADAYLYFYDDPWASLAALMSDTVKSLQSAGQDFEVVVDRADRMYYIGSFTPDGKRVTVVDRHPSGSVFQIYDRETGDVVTEEVHEGHVMVVTMIYDESDRRWKIEKMDEYPLAPDDDPQLYQEIIEDLHGEAPTSTENAGGGE